MASKISRPLLFILLIICANIFIIGCFHSIFSTKDAVVQKQAIFNIYPSSDAPEKKWNTTWGGSASDGGNDVALDAAGNIYVVGNTLSFGPGDENVALVKFASNGTKLWNVSWGPSMDNYGNGVIVDTAGNIYVCGHRSQLPGSNYDIFLTKFDSDGNPMWNTLWGGDDDDMGYDIVSDPSGNFYVCGTTLSFGAGNTDVVLVKFDSNGTKLWNYTWGASSYDQSSALTMDSSGNIYVCGFTQSFGVINSAVLLIKFAPNGMELWNFTWDSVHWDNGYGVAVDSSGNSYVVGTSSEVMDSSLVLIKIDSNGNKLWNITMEHASTSTSGNGVVVGSASEIYVCGSQQNSPADNDILVSKYDSNGNQLWKITWGGPASDIGKRLILDTLGYLYICGETVSFGAGSTDMALLKYYVKSSSTIPGFESLWLWIPLIIIFAFGAWITSSKKTTLIRP